MRKSKYLVGSLLTIFAIASCNNNTAPTSNSAPTIVGVKGFQCIVNTTVDFLDGVAALDKEDGDKDDVDEELDSEETDEEE